TDARGEGDCRPQRYEARYLQLGPGAPRGVPRAVGGPPGRGRRVAGPGGAAGSQSGGAGRAAVVATPAAGPLRGRDGGGRDGGGGGPPAPTPRGCVQSSRPPTEAEDPG